MRSDPSQSLEQAAAVFEGRVTAVDANGSGEPPEAHRVELAVQRAWKGMREENAVVKTAGSSAACGYGFELGETYLVYADRRDGELHVSLCSRTQPIAEAREDLEHLGSAAGPADGPTEPSPSGPAPPAARPEVASPPPSAGGCASCSLAAGGVARASQGRSPAMATALIVASLWLWRRRRLAAQRRASPCKVCYAR